MPGTDQTFQAAASLGSISAKIDVVLTRLEAICATIKDHEERIRVVEKNEEFEQRLRALELRQAASEHKIGLFAGLQATFTTIASVVAGWLGTRG